MLKKIKKMLGWAMGPTRAHEEGTRTHVPEGYTEMLTRLAKEIRECDERRLAYDARTMHRPGAQAPGNRSRSRTPGEYNIEMK